MARELVLLTGGAPALRCELDAAALLLLRCELDAAALLLLRCDLATRLPCAAVQAGSSGALAAKALVKAFENAVCNEAI